MKRKNSYYSNSPALLPVILIIPVLMVVVVCQIPCNGEYNAHCVNCTTFMTCIDGIAYPTTQTSCPAETSCNISFPEVCDGINGCKLPPFQCTADGRFPDRTNCSLYHMCKSNGTGGFYEYVYYCPAGTLFNPATSVCNLEASVTCTQLS